MSNRYAARGFRLLACLTVLAAMAGVPALLAQGPGAPPPTGPGPTPRDISGFWELRWDGRKLPSASLVPRLTPARLRVQRQKDADAVRWCNYMGVPWMMDSTGRPLNIVQGSIETVIVPESGVAFSRHIYSDGRGVPDLDLLDRGTNGFSTGRWDAGDVFVVTTLGFSDKGMTAIPGGGFRTEQSKLTERFRLVAGGTQLSVTATWDDPTVFRTPHTYELRYQRVAGDYRPRPTIPCDVLDNERVSYLGWKPAAGASAAAGTAR